MSGERDFRECAGRIEELVAQLEAIADPALRAAAKELVQSVMDLYSGGLERTLEIVSQSGEGGEEIIGRLGRDPLVGSLLALHGLHPADLETRLRRGLEKARPYLRKNGAEAELLGVEEGIVRLRVQVTAQSCGSTSAGLKETIETAVYEAAPDLAGLQIEGIEISSAVAGFVPLGMLGVAPPVPTAAGNSLSAPAGQSHSGERP